LGIGAWWDQDMPGVDWQDEIATKIDEMIGVVVLWTPSSINSKNVKDEARLAQHKDKLVNVLLGVSAPPFPFERTNGLPLDAWNGIDPHNGWTRLISTIDALAAKNGNGTAGAFTAALKQSETEIRSRRERMARAQSDFQAARTCRGRGERGSRRENKR
jgi:hypothetical protein